MENTYLCFLGGASLRKEKHPATSVLVKLDAISKLPFYLGLITCLIVSTFTYDGFNTIKVGALSTGAAVLLALSGRYRIFHYSKNKVPIAIFCLFVTSLVSLVILGSQPLLNSLHGTFGRANGALAYISLAVFFLFVSHIEALDIGEYFIKFVSNLGLFFALYGFVQKTGNDIFPWAGTLNEAVLTLGNPNFASAMMAISSIATATRIIQNQKRKNQWEFSNLLLFLSLGLQLLLLFSINSTQGVIVVVVGFLSLFSIVFHRSFLNASILRKSIIVLIIGLVGSVTALGVWGRGPLGQLLLGLRSIEDRFYHWESAIKMFSEFPIFGVGIDAFGDWYPRFRSLEAIALRGNADSFTNNAHNVPLQLLATGGLILFLPYLAILLYVFLRGLKLLRDKSSNPTVAGVISIWLAFQLQSLVSIDQIGLSIWGWLCAGVIVSMSRKTSAVEVSSLSKDKRTLLSHESSTRRSKVSDYAPGVIAGVIFLAISASTVVPTIVNEAQTQDEMQKFRYLEKQILAIDNSSTSYAAFKGELDKSANRVFELGVNSIHPTLRMFLAQELFRGEYPEESIKLVTLTSREFPRHWMAWNFLAEFYEQTGKLSLAVKVRQRQLELDPLNQGLADKLIATRDALIASDD
jgi:O-antigen ligase